MFRYNHTLHFVLNWFALLLAVFDGLLASVFLKSGDMAYLFACVGLLLAIVWWGERMGHHCTRIERSWRTSIDRFMVANSIPWPGESKPWRGPVYETKYNHKTLNRALKDDRRTP